MQAILKKFPEMTFNALREPGNICQVIADKKVSYRDLVIFHVILWAIAFFSRISYNIIGYLLRYIQDNEARLYLLKGALPLVVFYAGVFIVYYQLELLHLVFFRDIRKKNRLPLNNRKNLFVAALLPFSTTAIFWILPFPFNILMTLAGLGISVYSVYRLLIRECGHDGRSVLNFFLLAAFYFSLIGLFLALVYNIFRMIFL